MKLRTNKLKIKTKGKNNFEFFFFLRKGLSGISNKTIETSIKKIQLELENKNKK